MGTGMYPNTHADLTTQGITVGMQLNNEHAQRRRADVPSPHRKRAKWQQHKVMECKVEMQALSHHGKHC